MGCSEVSEVQGQSRAGDRHTGYLRGFFVVLPGLLRARNSQIPSTKYKTISKFQSPKQTKTLDAHRLVFGWRRTHDDARVVLALLAQGALRPRPCERQRAIHAADEPLAHFGS